MCACVCVCVREACCLAPPINTCTRRYRFVLCACVQQVKGRLAPLTLARVQHELVLDHADAHGCSWTSPRDVRGGQCGTCSVDGQLLDCV